MSKRALFYLSLVSLPLVLLVACSTIKSGFELPPKHPYALPAGQRPTCTECHDARGKNIHYESFNHTIFFLDNHRQEAYQHERVCALCHQTSFCNNCHATRVELKPSVKDQTDTYRSMPHRGDFLSRHQIEGRLDPTSCFRCHGNPKTAQACAPCHG